MIARILYRESVQGVLSYVFGKAKSTVLGYGNTYSETDTNPKHFSNILYHLGQRNESQKRYAHITINLPHGEKLNNQDFFGLSQQYLEHMGYGEQPYVVVRHHDTKHHHIHIVTSTVKEEGSMIDLSNDYRRNVATQKELEKSFGLSPSPETKLEKELPVYRLPEIKKDDSQGVKFYIQDIVNNTLQKYKVRSFEELAALVKPYHILVKPITNYKGRVGVSYGIAINNGYKSRFIDGYIVHPRLSGPKLQAVFQNNAKSKVLPMHRKRLEKQLLITYQLFNSIGPKELAPILKTYQKIDCRVRYNKKQEVCGFTVYDKSGYVFESSEISSKIGFDKQPVLINGKEHGDTHLNLESKQLVLEVRKLIKNAFYKMYLDSDKTDLLSNFVLTKNAKDILPTIMSMEMHALISKYVSKSQNKVLGKMIFSEFGPTRHTLHLTESKKEIEALEQKTVLLKEVLGKGVFDLGKDQGILYDLFQSVGVKYANGRISYLNSNHHHASLELGRLKLPQREASYVSTGFINENVKILDGLVSGKEFKKIGLGATSIFLPLMFPRLFDAMVPEHRMKFERLSLKSFHKAAEQFHIPYEKSPKDYIKLFNAKGFYFERKDGNIKLCSMYSKYPISITLPSKTQNYLMCLKDLDSVLNEQVGTLENIKSLGQGHLKNLWVSYLVERQLYGKVAFMISNDGIRPNLHPQVLKFHMENGLRENIISFSKQKINAQHASLLRKSVYAFSTLLGSSKAIQEEVFNGFRDELTDYGKYKNSLF